MRTRPFIVAAAVYCLAQGGLAMALSLQSPAFANGGEIPNQYSCQGAGVSPPLHWSGVPAKARSLALIMDDPDAPRGTWTHWLMWNIPATVQELHEGIAAAETAESGALQGRNDFNQPGYGGPCPPPGRPHRYYFRLYALDDVIDLKSYASRKDLERAIQKHVLDEAATMGTYRR